MTFPYSLDQLPLVGIGDITQTIGDVQGKLNDTQMRLNAILNAPFSLTGDLKQAIANIRFHVTIGLLLIDSSFAQGANARQPFVDVTGLKAAIENYVFEVAEAKPLWQAWLVDAYKNKLPGDTTDLPAMLQKPPPAVSVAPSGVLASLTQTPTKTDYLGMGLVAAGVFLLWKVFK